MKKRLVHTHRQMQLFVLVTLTDDDEYAAGRRTRMRCVFAREQNGNIVINVNYAIECKTLEKLT